MSISLKKATAILKKALKTLPKLAAELEKPKPAAALPRGPRPVVWRLALDEVEDTGVQLRPRLPFNHRPTGARALSGAGAKPLSEVVEPLELDPITVADDAHFLERIAEERNLPPFVKEGLLELYNG